MMSDFRFKLFLFATEQRFIRKAILSGVSGIVVDWEYQGKQERQFGADTQINRHSVEDLINIRHSTDATVICRLNAFNTTTPEEVEKAIGGGADELLLPMVRTVEEVKAVSNLVRSRCKLGILVETENALRISKALSHLKLSRVYMGFNDLAIERKTPNIFSPVIDGTLEKIRGYFNVPFGFGGLTLPDCGYPIPCRLLIAEMVRLGCSFSFLRRSFYRDIHNREVFVEIPRLIKALRDARNRDRSAIKKDREELEACIRHWPTDKSLFTFRK
jgi:hypothetical protein